MCRPHWRGIMEMSHSVGVPLMRVTRCRCCEEQSYESHSNGFYTCRYCDFISPDGTVVPEMGGPEDRKLPRIKQIVDRLRKSAPEDEPEDRD